jgi:hypothetical protein
MKVSDPIIFGHAVRALLGDVMDVHADALAALRRRSGRRPRCDARGHRAAPRRRARDRRGRDPRRRRRRTGARLRRLRPRHHEPARPLRRHHRRVDARDDPHVRATCGERTVSPATRRPSSPTRATRRCTRRRSRTAAATARSTPRGWGRCRTSGSWPRRPRSTARTTRPSASPPPGRSVSSPTARRSARARRRAGRHLAHVPHDRRGDPRLGPALRRAQSPQRHPGRVLARRDACARRPADREARGGARRPRHRRARPLRHAARRGDPAHARPLPRRPGHDRRDRQRAARLPHGPVPDPRARDEREDAVDRPADGGRRAVRDGRRRVGAEARPAAR